MSQPIPRWYQQEATDQSVQFLHHKKEENGLVILPTGSGKSIVIANIAKEAEGQTVVFQPTKEILAHNFRKFTSYGYRAGIYSASAGMKFADKVTFATIGSVAGKPYLFRDARNVIIDEAHLANPEAGQYKDFIQGLQEQNKVKVVGLTASPYRLASTADGSQLRFLTRQRPRMFGKVLYYVQKDVLFKQGHLCPLEYFTFDVVDRRMLTVNTAGSDFTESSVKNYLSRIDMPSRVVEYAKRILVKRRNLLVFCSLISEAKSVAARIDGAEVVTGDTPSGERDRILNRFLRGITKCVVNVGVLTTGFDFPGLEAILVGKSTMSLGWWEQVCGRGTRPCPGSGKESCWIVDMGGNFRLFGRIETMLIKQTPTGLFYIENNGRQLTNVTFTKY